MSLIMMRDTGSLHIITTAKQLILWRLKRRLTRIQRILN